VFAELGSVGEVVVVGKKPYYLVQSPVMGPEQRLSSSVRVWLNQAQLAGGVYALKVNTAGNRGVPDWLIVSHGRAMFIELKAPGEDMSKLQLHTARRIAERGGASVAVCRSLAEVKQCVTRFVEISSALLT